ncbi:contact-dependent growth inhibition system immunity protein [Paraburkholderia ferrariae]|uniref:contact-dependent growth inhibition system immunity protein n=1 Tax=Paraburkholderia ferrariae TaxID=386056 RepID=UPI000487E1A7|nr:contact-dependent growth inhibition system immunity protein [Paraburkholderia ferrariae]
MINEKSYPQFHTLFGAYLNQDSDYWGETLEEVVSCFKRDSSPSEIVKILNEIERFKNEAGENLDKEFYDLYGFNFSPVSWGYTTVSFFEELKRILSD